METSKEEWREWLHHPLTSKALKLLEQEAEAVGGNWNKSGNWEDILKLKGEVAGIKQAANFLKELPL